MPMQAIAINGSPRADGNTEFLLRRALAPLEAAGWDTEFAAIGGQAVRGCTACFQCFEKRNRRCAVESDGMNGFLAKIFAADAILLGSPTYFSDVTAELKALIDRGGLVSIANGGLLKGKIGAAVVAVRRGGGTHVFDTINHFYLMSSMIVPGSFYWNLGYGLEKEDARGDREAVRNMEHLGKVIAWLGLAFHNAPGPYPDPPSDKV